MLAGTLRLAHQEWGARPVGAYALGSLAHGGFSVHVSDVDFAVVLADPLQPEDASRVEALQAEMTKAGELLSDRLSIFWGTPSTLAGESQGGRFPPVDVLDLK